MAEQGFTGFPDATLRFYADVAQNNTREWYADHRERYVTDVIAPAQAFIEALGARLREWRPEIGYDVDPNGKGSFKKLHTDQRFRDRPPLKTYAQIIFWEGPLPARKANSTFMVTFAPGRVALGAGLMYFEADTLRAYREAVAHETTGLRLADAVAAAEQGGYVVEGRHYKTVPRGYPADHPRGELLKFNAISASRDEPVPAEFGTAAFVDWCLERFEPVRPLHDWCVDLLGRE
jgi:uncharacterized protein (TIGR02453 family)